MGHSANLKSGPSCSSFTAQTVLTPRRP
jgi:hypothetical protein